MEAEPTPPPHLLSSGPPFSPPVNDTIKTIVANLINPLEAMYSKDGADIIFTIIWAIGVTGNERFESPLLGCPALLQNDDLCKFGLGAGLSEEILNWLQTGEEELKLPASHFQKLWSV